MDLAVVEGVVRGAVDALERLGGVGVVRHVVVVVVVAGQVPPGQADGRHDVVHARVAGEVVVDDVAHGEPERGVRADKLRHDVVADVVELLLAVGLGVGEDDDVELLGLLLPYDGEVHRLGERSGGFDPAVLQLDRRAVRVVDVVVLRELLIVHRHHVAGRLRDEQDGLVVHAQPVRAAPIGLDDLSTVGHEYPGDTGLALVALAVSIAVLVHEPLSGLLRPVHPSRLASFLGRACWSRIGRSC